MTAQEFHDEYAYNITMSHVKKMLESGLISPEEYLAIDKKMKAKYNPVSGGLILAVSAAPLLKKYAV